MFRKKMLSDREKFGEFLTTKQLEKERATKKTSRGKTITAFAGPFKTRNSFDPHACMSYTGMEITGIASQFAMQSRPICDASSNMRRNNCNA